MTKFKVLCEHTMVNFPFFPLNYSAVRTNSNQPEALFFLSTNQKHYQDLGRDTSLVWDFCARYSDVVLRGLKWRPRETSAVYSG